MCSCKVLHAHCANLQNLNMVAWFCNLSLSRAPSSLQKSQYERVDLFEIMFVNKTKVIIVFGWHTLLVFRCFHERVDGREFAFLDRCTQYDGTL